MESQSECAHNGVHVFAHFGADLHAQSVIINKNFCIGAQSEVYQECAVGWVARNGPLFVGQMRRSSLIGGNLGGWVGGSAQRSLNPDKFVVLFETGIRGRNFDSFSRLHLLPPLPHPHICSTHAEGRLCLLQGEEKAFFLLLLLLIMVTIIIIFIIIVMMLKIDWDTR